jgi:hypothetical protein
MGDFASARFRLCAGLRFSGGVEMRTLEAPSDKRKLHFIVTRKTVEKNARQVVIARFATSADAMQFIDAVAYVENASWFALWKRDRLIYAKSGKDA